VPPEATLDFGFLITDRQGLSDLAYLLWDPQRSRPSEAIDDSGTAVISALDLPNEVAGEMAPNGRWASFCCSGRGWFSTGDESRSEENRWTPSSPEGDGVMSLEQPLH
jgi:hypothetical protein